MTEHPNDERARRGLDAFAAGDFGALAALIDEDCVWRIRGANVLAGEYRGREAIFRLFRWTAELSGGTYRVEPRWIVADDERVVIVYRASGRRDGRSIDVDQALLCKIAEGVWIDVDALPFDQHAFDAFWS
jgi:ketosteroid isomerase-like protein